MNKGLLIIDVQNDYFEGGRMELYKPLDALKNIEAVLNLFREKNLPVIHVQHVNTREGASFFLPDTDGVKIHKNLTPRENEFHVVKHAPSGFLGTDLPDIIKENDISEMVVCGMMTHMCVDTTVWACMDYGIKVTLPEDACAAKNLEYNGEVLPAETVRKVFMASLDKLFANVIKTADITFS